MHTARSFHMHLSDKMRVAPKVFLGFFLFVFFIKVNNEVWGDIYNRAGRQAIQDSVWICGKVRFWHEKEQSALRWKSNKFLFIVAVVCQTIALITAWRSQFTHLLKPPVAIRQCLLYIYRPSCSQSVRGILFWEWPAQANTVMHTRVRAYKHKSPRHFCAFDQVQIVQTSFVRKSEFIPGSRSTERVLNLLRCVA